MCRRAPPPGLVRLSQGRRGQGKSAPPQSTAAPLGPEPPGRPPAAVGDRRQGTRLPAPPGPRAARDGPEGQRPRTLPGGPLHPGGGHPGRGKHSRAPSAPVGPPAHSRITRYRPTTERRTQEGANRAPHSEAGLGEAGARIRARRSLPPQPPPPRHTDSLLADRAAPDAHGRPATPTAGV